MEALEIFPCERCGRNFEYKYALKRHLKNCTKDAPETCKSCLKVLENHISLLTHKKDCPSTVVIGVVEVLQCSICGKNIRYAFNLRRHLRFFHDIKADTVEYLLQMSKKNCEKFNYVKKTKRNLDNKSPEDSCTIQFGKESDDKVSACTLISPSIASNDVIVIESDDDDDEKIDEQYTTFKYEDSSDEDCASTKGNTCSSEKIS